ncbi:hypothetical protein [Variovorax sp.]|uniref:hypothetical protein n=1 Tax=Variovorax sp. TaxID=1871043 RepID=UPI004037B4D6
MMKELHDRFATQPSQQLTAPKLRRIIWGLIAAIWLPLLALPAFAAAAQADLADPLNIPPVLMVLALVISSLSGATALLMRIDRELSAAPDKPLLRPWLMCASHMAGAWLAGTLAFIVARQTSLDVWTTLGLVLTASFANAKFIESMLERFMPGRLNTGGSNP